LEICSLYVLPDSPPSFAVGPHADDEHPITQLPFVVPANGPVPDYFYSFRTFFEFNRIFCEGEPLLKAIGKKKAPAATMTFLKLGGD